MNTITRRTALKQAGLGVTAIGLAGATVSCGDPKLISYIETVISSFESARPFFLELIPSAVPTIDKAIAVAKALDTALKNGSTSAIDLLAQLIAPGGLFDQILDATNLVTDPAKRKLISGILLLASTALRLIAIGLHQGSSTTPTGPAMLARAKETNSEVAAVIEKAATSDVLEKGLAASKF